jgi:hypothetical protein
MKNELGFISKFGDKISDYWSVNNTGDWAADCTTGREYASQLVIKMKTDNNPLLLSQVIYAMSAKKKINGIEAGFLTAIGVATMQ